MLLDIRTVVILRGDGDWKGGPRRGFWDIDHVLSPDLGGSDATGFTL